MPDPSLLCKLKESFEEDPKQAILQNSFRWKEQKDRKEERCHFPSNCGRLYFISWLHLCRYTVILREENRLPHVILIFHNIVTRKGGKANSFASRLTFVTRSYQARLYTYHNWLPIALVSKEWRRVTLSLITHHECRSGQGIFF